MQFEIISLLSESKKIIEYLQKSGAVQLEDAMQEDLIKYKTDAIVSQFEKKRSRVVDAYSVLESHCSIKKSFIESFNDCKEIEYSEYKLLSDKADNLLRISDTIISLRQRYSSLNEEISRLETLIDFYKPWISLDIPMASRRTITTNIYIGTFPRKYEKEELIEIIFEKNKLLDDVELQIVFKDKLLTCAVFMCHQSSAEALLETLRSIDFVIPDNLPPRLPSKAIEDCENEILHLKAEISACLEEIKGYVSYYDELRFLSDYYSAQIDKYIAVENAASTEMTFYIRGYITERESEDVKFEIENSFTAQMEITEPDYENSDVPVLIENRSFAAGVESITEMYSPPSNNDVDPNPVMALFYYIFFGLMLSDAGYGLLMIAFSIFAKKKLKVKDNMKKFSDMVLYCGIATVFWGAMFGGWFGDLIPTVCTAFLGFENPPKLALWLDPMTNSITLLLFSFLLGILHLFAGLAIRFFMLVKAKNYIGAIFDVIPVVIFVIGFAIVGAGFFTTVPESIKPWGTRLLITGSVAIVLTAGRSSKNILGKLGGGLYALYSTASGYLGDILSYSRLLALSLVTGVIANVINLLGAMFGNVIAFIFVFLLGHTINIAINIIGTYVHTCRLQYVEFFSKFYEGEGKQFTPFKINSKFFTVKEDKKYG